MTGLICVGASNLAPFPKLTGYINYWSDPRDVVHATKCHLTSSEKEKKRKTKERAKKKKGPGCVSKFRQALITTLSDEAILSIRSF